MTSPKELRPGRDARREASDLVGSRYCPRVLEPSPPAVLDGDWFADDPVHAGCEPAAVVIDAVPGRGMTWGDWLADHPADERWVAERWLGAYRRLPPAPAGLSGTRRALHRVAVHVVATARQRCNDKIGLRWTLGGFGTPFFGSDEQVRVERTSIVRQRDGQQVERPLTTVTVAATLALDGPSDARWARGLDVPPLDDPDQPLDLDEEAAAWIGEWFGLATSALEELRADPESTEPSRVQLWPEHFDAALECLPGTRRAGFGASPGDEAINEPYLYVVPWHPDVLSNRAAWNAPSFRGAYLPWSELERAHDQRAVALRFWREHRELLAD